MSEESVVDAEYTEEQEGTTGSEIAVRHHTGSGVSLFGTDDPTLVVEKASKVARALADVIERQNLYHVIQGKKHVVVEGWTLLGSMLGVFPVLEECDPIELHGVKGFRATVAAQTRSGDTVGRATAFCMRDEKRGPWKSADDYAVASMAQTRATSKALRAPLGFVMTLAGYEATPEAEMAGVVGDPAAEPEPSGPSASLLDRLREGIEKLDGKTGWSVPEILAQASKTYGRPVGTLYDLRDSEIEQIIAAMKTYGGVEV